MAPSEASQPNPSHLSGVERILVIRPGAIGDALVTLPVLSSLRAYYPDACIEFVVSSAVVSLLRGRCDATIVRSFESPELLPLFVRDHSLPHSTRHWLGAFALIVAYLLPDSPLLRGIRLGARGKVCALDPRPPLGSGLPMHTYLQQPLQLLGIARLVSPPRLRLLREDRECAASFWNGAKLRRPEPVFALHPGSGSVRKNWPAERFARLADRLTSETGCTVAVVSGPADEEPVARMLAHVSVAQPVLLQNLPLPHLAAILARCRFFVGNDSGIAHLAAAVGLPGVAIFGPTDPRTWSPGPSFLPVGTKKECSPCDDDCRRACVEMACLLQITVQQVYKAIMDSLAITDASSPTEP